MDERTCTRHGIVRCAYCLGLVDPYEPPEHQGTTRKPYEPYSRGIVTGPKRPAVHFNPQGSGQRRFTEPKPDHPITTARVHRADGVARYNPYTRQKYGDNPTPYRVEPQDRTILDRKAANRALAKRLGITLPE